jgi:hypothetical protein
MVESSFDEVHSNHSYLQSPVVLVADWLGFLLLLLSAIILAYKLMKFRGPSDRSEDYFFGYLTFMRQSMTNDII